MTRGFVGRLKCSACVRIRASVLKISLRTFVDMINNKAVYSSSVLNDGERGSWNLKRNVLMEEM